MRRRVVLLEGGGASANEVENLIVNGVELSQPAELCEVFRNYFSSAFRKDDGSSPKLNYSAISRMQHFIISAEET